MDLRVRAWCCRTAWLLFAIALLPAHLAAPGQAEERLPGRGQDDAPADQPTRRPPPDAGDDTDNEQGVDPAPVDPEPTTEPTAAPEATADAPTEETEPQQSSAETTDPFATLEETAEPEASPLVSVLVWVAAIGAAIGAGWLVVRKVRPPGQAR